MSSTKSHSRLTHRVLAASPTRADGVDVTPKHVRYPRHGSPAGEDTLAGDNDCDADDSGDDNRSTRTSASEFISYPITIVKVGCTYRAATHTSHVCFRVD
jgi:hypothetical protein